MAGLQVQGLEAGYDRLQVLHGIDVDVAPGELVAVIGANGAGKSTLLRAVSGLLRPRAGRVLLNGEDITTASAERIAARGLAHVPENRLVFPSLTVDDNLSLGGWTRRKDGHRAERRRQVLELFPRLADRICLPAGALSGGEQQMLAMARAVMLNPEVVLLDEPSMGLAPILVAEVFRIIERLKSEGVTMLLVEQFAAAALGVADYGYVLENGRISVHGPAEKLRDDPAVKAAYLGGAGSH